MGRGGAGGSLDAGERVRRYSSSLGAGNRAPWGSAGHFDEGIGMMARQPRRVVETAALRRYRELQVLLKRELGVDPKPATRALLDGARAAA